ncbi:MAG: radical SAM protein [Acidobacteria bacterium]|jgi:wyosine [tRNA(Phe)-imidazoG37] synthetase (radical SAM superfamily)|nr:radical SAM protein [Acidobacteriota bacterium]
MGASLGVDVVPMKVCTYDCIYCQLGPTQTLTTERVAFYPVDEILADVEKWLRSRPAPDVITFAGSGEPTLFSQMGELIREVKGLTRIPLALLTNGSLFHDPDVRRESSCADIVLPSLDAGDEETFQLVNRPAPGLTLDEVTRGLVEFRREYAGEIRLEVMVLDGITDIPDRVAQIARLARRIQPDRIDLNTPVRPTFDERAVPVPWERLAELAELFSPVAEVVAETGTPGDESAVSRSPQGEEILALLFRRPCTADDIAAGLGLHPVAVMKELALLRRRGQVHRVVRGARVFWHARAEGKGELQEDLR